MAKRISIAQLERDRGESAEELAEQMMSEGMGPALCDEGCEVEADGECPHGNPSLLLEMGMI